MASASAETLLYFNEHLSDEAITSSAQCKSISERSYTKMETIYHIYGYLVLP